MLCPTPIIHSLPFYLPFLSFLMSNISADCHTYTRDTQTKNNVCIQLASNYRGFIDDVNLEISNDAVHVSTDASNFVFQRGTTLRDIAKACWCESKPLLFRNGIPAVTPAHDLLDVSIPQLLTENQQLILEINEKGAILYKD
jgi:hypothetical protein